MIYHLIVHFCRTLAVSFTELCRGFLAFRFLMKHQNKVEEEARVKTRHFSLLPMVRQTQAWTGPLPKQNRLNHGRGEARKQDQKLILILSYNNRCFSNSYTNKWSKGIVLCNKSKGCTLNRENIPRNNLHLH